MAKNIIICSDGTGNSANKGRGTNVFKLYEALNLSSHRLTDDPPKQVAFYDDGVGTESARWQRLLGGAFGKGLSRNIRELYRELCRVYEPGDQIYLFGFSRGAFTVRTLAGVIIEHGIVPRSAWNNDAELKKISRDIWRSHRHQYDSYLGCFYRRITDSFLKIDEVQEKFHLDTLSEKSVTKERPTIKMVGVWDTVAAYGFPVDWVAKWANKYVYRFSFTDQILSRHVEKGCHALSIDDERHTFLPTLWEHDEKRGEKKRIEQVWFAGVHSNVGGGYVKQGLSLVTLDWMVTRAEEQGLLFHEGVRDNFRHHANVNDTLYDSRAGLGRFYRYTPRDIHKLCTSFKREEKRDCSKSRNAADCPPPAEREILPVPVEIHDSVFERLKLGTGGYAPGVLPENFTIVGTSRKPSKKWQASVKDITASYHQGITATPDAFSSADYSIRQRSYLSYRIMHVFVLAVIASVVLAISYLYFCFADDTTPASPSLLLLSACISAVIALISGSYSQFIRSRHEPIISNARSQFWRGVFADRKHNKNSK